MDFYVDKSDFDRTKRGSFYTVGAKNPERYVVMLHGSSQNAERMEQSASTLVRKIPNTQVIIPNGHVDNFQPNCRARNKAKAAGERFDWQMWSREDIARYEQHYKTDNPFYKIDGNHVPGDKAIHLYGFSAGAYGAINEFITAPSRYASVTLQGYHLSNQITERLIATSQKNPTVLDTPIMISLPFFDPLSLFNKNATTSKAIQSIPTGITRIFGGRHQQHQEHGANINRLKEAGFSIVNAPSFMTAHNITDETLTQTAQFIEASEGIPPAHTLLSAPDRAL